MTPQQKLKHLILLKWAVYTGQDLPEVSVETIDQVFENIEALADGDLQDAMNEVRCSGEPTALRCEFSRHYESMAVAAQTLDGSWVGWTYYYGGGNHGSPEEMPWLEDAYDVRVTRVFARADALDAAEISAAT